MIKMLVKVQGPLGFHQVIIVNTVTATDAMARAAQWYRGDGMELLAVDDEETAEIELKDVPRGWVVRDNKHGVYAASNRFYYEEDDMQ